MVEMPLRPPPRMDTPLSGVSTAAASLSGDTIPPSSESVRSSSLTAVPASPSSLSSISPLTPLCWGDRLAQATVVFFTSSRCNGTAAKGETTLCSSVDHSLKPLSSGTAPRLARQTTASIMNSRRLFRPPLLPLPLPPPSPMPLPPRLVPWKWKHVKRM